MSPSAGRHHPLPEAFGCQIWLTATVGTVAELDAVLDRIDAHEGAACVDVMMPGEESQHMREAVVDSGYKLRTPPVG